MLIRRVSEFSGVVRELEIPVTIAQMNTWREDGVPIQEAIPHLTASQREYLMTGITDEEWEQMFSTDEGC